MLEMLVELFWQEEELASASFSGFSFWTETGWIYLVDQNDVYGADLLELRVLLEVLEMVLISEFLE